MHLIIALGICVAISVSVAFITIRVLKKEIFGGLRGTLLVAFLGATFGFVFHFAFIYIYKFLVLTLDAVYFLMGMSGEFPPIDIPAAVVSSVVFVILLQKISPRR